MKILRIAAFLTASLILLPLSALEPVQPPGLSFEKPAGDFVLILHSYHQGYAWTDAEDAGIREVLAKRLPFVEIVEEHLDARRFRGPGHLDFMANVLLKKYAGRRPLAAIAVDDAALDLALARRDELLQGAPVVFCGVNKRREHLPPGVAGIYEHLDFEGTFELVFALQPETKRIFVVQDDFNSPPGGFFKESALVAMRLKPGVKVESSGGVPPEALAEKLASLGRGDVVVQGSYNNSADGRSFSIEDVLLLIKRNANAPVYGLWSFSFGEGVLGGSMLDGRRHGAEAAEMALRVIAGESPSSIQASELSQTRRLVDYREMLRFGLDFKRLPPGYAVEFRPASFYELHKTLIWVSSAVIALQFATIALLLANFLRRRRAEAQLLKQSSILKSTLQNIPFDFWVRDTDDKIILQSRESIRLWGDLAGRGTDGFDYAFDWKASNSRALSGQIVDRDVEYLKDGELRSYRNIIAPVNCDGHAIGTIGMNIDMTISRRAEESIRAGEASLRATLDSIADAVIATDRDSKITRFNPAAAKLAGYAASDALGRHISELLRLVDSESGEPLPNIAACILDGSSSPAMPLRCDLLAKDGSQRKISANGAQICDASGAVSGVALVIRDVTEEQLLQEQLRQAKKLETVGQLAGGVAHDFNNMLSAILGSAEMLSLQAGSDVKMKRYAKIILEAGGRAASLVKKLLDFSRQGKFESAPVDMHACIVSAIGLLERSIDRKISIETGFMAKDFVVMGDLAQLQNSVLNLALNARDAMPSGGTISFMTRNLSLDEAFCHGDPLHEIKPGEHLEIDVFDTGAGMDAKTIERIFEPFFTTKKVGSGSGLGLPAVYGCMKDHKGSIRVSSEPGHGSVFKLFLPILKQEPLPARSSLGPKAGALVLLVDDEPTVQNSVHGMLCELGYRVIIAKDATDAVDTFKLNPDIDLVMLDMIMPKMNGSEVFGALRQIRADARILLCSGFSKDGQVQALLEQGARGFLAKPCNMRELSTAIREALS